MAKKPFNTPVDNALADKVRAKCVKDDIRITDLMEALMTLYINDEIEVKKQVSYKVKLKSEGDE